jgi:hypothetical protein
MVRFKYSIKVTIWVLRSAGLLKFLCFSNPHQELMYSQYRV